jgi:long-subunit fatty acid transport protein
LLCGPVAAVETDYAAGTRALPLQQAGGTARAMSMGSAVVAVSQESASLLWNPAGLSRMSGTEVGLHHNTGLGDTIQEIAIIGRKASVGGIAASFGYVNYGSFVGRDDTGNPTGNYHAGDLSGSLGWGKDLLPGLSGGVVLKFNQSNFGNRSYNAFATDVGVLWNAVPDIDLGAVYSNLNLGDKIGGSQLASGWRLGAAWTMDKRLILAASSELQNGAMDRLQLGVEYRIADTAGRTNPLALRAGYQIDSPDSHLAGLTGLTLGLGYAITRSVTLDYAMVPAGDLGTSHRLSVTFKP